LPLDAVQAQTLPDRWPVRFTLPLLAGTSGLLWISIYYAFQRALSS
jgi:hypothetical protein